MELHDLCIETLCLAGVEQLGLQLPYSKFHHDAAMKPALLVQACLIIRKKDRDSNCEKRSGPAPTRCWPALVA